MATINSPISYRENSEASLDGRYGPWIGTPAQVHSQLLENEIVIVETLTIGIKANTTAPTVEYWYQGGTEMANLVPKYVCELTSELKDKLTNMPTIVLKENNIITIDNQDFILTPAEEPDPPAPTTSHDYYVGWTNASKSDFNALTDAQLEALATGCDIAQQNTYSHDFGQNNIFFLLYKAANAPQGVTLTSSGQAMAQNLVSDNSFTGHANVEVDGETYNLFGIRLSSGYDQSDTITVTFNN